GCVLRASDALLFVKQGFAVAPPIEEGTRPSACCRRTRSRKGDLNQAAYSLLLFIRDLCDGDLVGWIDQRLATADEPTLKSLGEDTLNKISGINNPIRVTMAHCAFKPEKLPDKSKEGEWGVRFH